MSCEPPADCPTLACVEELRVDVLEACTALDVTKFPSARVLKASLENVAGLEPPPISWLAQLTGLPQLTKVELDCGEVTPDDFLTQLPAGCELIMNTTSLALEESLPHHASLAHLVTLNVEQCCCHPYTLLEFSCLASCPNLRYVWQSFDEMHRRFDPTDPDWVDLSTLNHLPTHCSVVLGFPGAAFWIDAFQPPAGWSVAPWVSGSELIFFRTGSKSMNT